MITLKKVMTDSALRPMDPRTVPKVRQKKISNQRKHLCPQARVNLMMRMTWLPLKHLQPLAFLQERMMTKTWSRPKRWTQMCLSGSLFMIRTKKIKP